MLLCLLAFVIFLEYVYSNVSDKLHKHFPKNDDIYMNIMGKSNIGSIKAYVYSEYKYNKSWTLFPVGSICLYFKK